MKINNNLDNDKATLKEQAQNIVNSIVKFNIFNDEDLQYKIQSKILNEANNGERKLNIYLRKMPKNYRGVHGFSISSVVINLDNYPTTTMKEIYDELAKWLQIQGFLPQDIFYTPPSEDENSCEPLIGTVTVKW